MKIWCLFRKTKLLKLKTRLLNPKIRLLRQPSIQLNVSKNTRSKVMALFKTYGNEGIFGRSDIATVTAASYSSAGDLIVKLKDSGLIVEVKGHGKGKYRFSENTL